MPEPRRVSGEDPPGGRDEPAEDTLLAGRVRLLQPRSGHRAGTDAVILAAALAPRPGDLVVDVGAGTGAVGLMIAARSTEPFSLAFVEREPELAALCRENVRRNGLEDRARVLVADVLDPSFGPGDIGGPATVVVTNPPFLEAGSGRPSPDPKRAAARQLPRGGFDRWVAASANLLGDAGRFALIQRADRLADCLAAMGRHFGAIEVRSVHPRAGEPARRIVMTGVKGSRAPLTIAAPLVLHEPDGTFRPEAAALHRGE